MFVLLYCSRVQCPACSVQHEIYPFHRLRTVYERDARYANIEGAYFIPEMPILKAHTSCRLPLFLPMDGRIAVRATPASVIASVEASSAKKRVLVLQNCTGLYSPLGWRGLLRAMVRAKQYGTQRIYELGLFFI
jgi:hypothetical protein